MKSKFSKIIGLLAISTFFIGVFSASAGIVTITNKETGSTATINTNGSLVSTSSRATSTVATSTVASTCVPYITNFHKYGDKGDEIISLQKFLNRVNGAKLNEKGFYGPVTMQEVKNLQYTYGIKVTGNQHILTTALINNINCKVITLKDRKVYVEKRISYVTPSRENYISTSSNTLEEKIQKTQEKVAQILVNNLISNENKKASTTTKEIKNEVKIGTTSASTSTFQSILEKEIENIKENYKSYVVVFLLIVALFWFLRKTATE